MEEKVCACVRARVYVCTVCGGKGPRVSCWSLLGPRVSCWSLLWLYSYHGIEQSQHIECVLESQYIRLLVFAFVAIQLLRHRAKPFKVT